MDYQNIHLTGRDLFEVSRSEPAHLCLIDPLEFARQLLRERNERQAGDPRSMTAELTRVVAYRGLPSTVHEPQANARNQAQAAAWEASSPKVGVHHRPLKYQYEYDEEGERVLDEEGVSVVVGRREKGIDVLCALAVVREAADPSVGLVILASHDTDLEPALDEAVRVARGQTRIETMTWFDPEQPKKCHQLRLAPPTDGNPRRSLWNTRLNQDKFQRCWDVRDYSQVGSLQAPAP